MRPPMAPVGIVRDTCTPFPTLRLDRALDALEPPESAPLRARAPRPTNAQSQSRPWYANHFDALKMAPSPAQVSRVHE